MAKAELADGKIHIEAHGKQRDKCALIPGAKWRNERWEVPLSWSACKQLRGILGEELEIGDDLYDWAQFEYANRVAPCEQLRQATDVPSDAGLCEGLYPFQKAGALFLITAQQVILADPMGSGKTVQAAAAARYIEEFKPLGLGSLPALVVCPAATQGSWQRELKKWAGINSLIIEGSATKRKKLLSKLGYGTIGTCEIHNAPTRIDPTTLEDYVSPATTNLSNPSKSQNLDQSGCPTATQTQFTTAKGSALSATESLQELGPITHQPVTPINQTGVEDCVSVVIGSGEILEQTIQPIATPNETTMPRDCAKAATTANCSKVTLNIGNEQPSKQGSENTESRKNSTNNWLQRVAESADSAENLTQMPLTTTTLPEKSEDYSVESVTCVSAEPTKISTGSNEPKCTCYLVAIMKWELVRYHSRLAPYGSMRLTEEDRREKELNGIDWQLVIIDEAHRMQDPKSKQTRATWWLGKDAHYRWAMTGTPVTNTPETLFPLLHFVKPEEWPSKGSFVDRYCDTQPRYWGPGVDITGINEATKEEFFEILDPRFRRMPKEIVLPHLPPVQTIRRDIILGTEQRRAYDEMAAEMVTETPNGELLIALNPITKLTRCMQFATSTIELILQEDGSTKAKLIDPSPKLDMLMEDLGDFLPQGESVAVFAVSRQIIEMAELRLQAKKIAYSVIKGGQSATDRQSQMDAFQNGEVQVILVVIAAGGTGITLTKARIGIFLQRPFSNVEYQQALARFNRIGSEIHDSIIVIDYVSVGTVEVGQLRILNTKGERLEEIVRDREAIKRMLSGLEPDEEDDD